MEKSCLGGCWQALGTSLELARVHSKALCLGFPPHVAVPCWHRTTWVLGASGEVLSLGTAVEPHAQSRNQGASTQRCHGAGQTGFVHGLPSRDPRGN